MLCLPLLLLSCLLAAEDRAGILTLGYSHHLDWDEAYAPNPYNVGLGYIYMQDKGGGFWPTYGAALYIDSYSELAGLAFVAATFRTPGTGLAAEAGVGMSYWIGSGRHGVSPVGYAGLGYVLGTAMFIDALYDGNVAAMWLRMDVPLIAD